jgi:hypothetical protein
MPLPAPVTRITLSLNVGDIVVGCTCFCGQRKDRR